MCLITLPKGILINIFLLMATCCLRITFAISLSPDQDRQNPALDPNRLTLIVFKKILFKKVYVKKSANYNKSIKKLASMQRVQYDVYAATVMCSFSLSHMPFMEEFMRRFR